MCSKVVPGGTLLGDSYLQKKWREKPEGSEALFACILLRINTNVERNECAESGPRKIQKQEVTMQVRGIAGLGSVKQRTRGRDNKYPKK